MIRRFVIRGHQQRQAICQLAHNVPEGIEVIFRHEQKQRKSAQNALMWAGLLSRVSRNAWVSGRQYEPEIWHEFFKKEFLPESFEEGITLDGYEKYKFLPDGSMTMVGSTTKLTPKGFAEYLQKVEAYCAVDLGIDLYADERMFA